MRSAAESHRFLVAQAQLQLHEQPKKDEALRGTGRLPQVPSTQERLKDAVTSQRDVSPEERPKVLLAKNIVLYVFF